MNLNFLKTAGVAIALTLSISNSTYAKDYPDPNGYNFCIINRLKPGFPGINQTYSTIHVGSINSNWGTVKIDRHHKHRIPKWAFPIRVCTEENLYKDGPSRGHCYGDFTPINEPGCYKIHTGTSRQHSGPNYDLGSLTYKKLTGKEAHKKCTCK